ncbi:hypothetical protein DSOL_4784 [Desulfosporosinus metallidurans]|uniref:Uncharacterized protein n=1 Tax=Desulfosporosinus metallidurans TaxID=1888891 RepID=A0A1Q8QHV7_9FIRM|nr:hypothetical protein DSOL_4784 [Desulfosporosinus metallidurans]
MSGKYGRLRQFSLTYKDIREFCSSKTLKEASHRIIVI